MKDGRRDMRGRILFWLALTAAVAAAAADDPPPEAAYTGADSVLLAEVRRGFETAPESAAETRRLIERLDASLPAEADAWPAVLRAYRAALEGLAGKHGRTPWEKYTRAQAGISRFEGLVDAYPESTEIRMLRYTFAGQLPDFFGLRPQADADLPVLVGLLVDGRDPMVTEAYRADAARWILRHGDPSPDLRRRLEVWLESTP
ncbi:MAG: hypothetical protein GX548_03085 [Lentisphaerae bacterium]|nr:hypothetical protein [Lentisphaerota bacterium]